MSRQKTLSGIVRYLPETGETDWGSQVLGVLDDLIDVAENITSGTITHAGDVEINGSAIATVQLRVRAATGQTADIARISSAGGSSDYFKIDSAGLAILYGGAWNSSHMVLGTYHLWIGSAGDLRVKSSAPTSAGDGASVGEAVGGSLVITGTNAATVPLTAKGAAAQTADLLKLTNSSSVDQFAVQDDGTTVITGGAYNTGHLVMGSYHFWVGSNGDLRVKSSAPSSADDGASVASAIYDSILVTNQAAAEVPIKVLAHASQSANLLELWDSTGSTRHFAIGTDGTETITGGAYNSGHVILGTYHLWIDSAGDLRVKNGSPASATDGSPVGITNTNRQILTGWYMDNVPASMSNTVMEYLSGAGSRTIRMHRAGSIVGACLYVSSSDKVTAGEAYIIVYKNGVTMGITGLPKLDTSGAPNDEYRYNTYAKGAWTFAAGDTLAIYLNANSALLPNGTSDMRAYIEIET
jgi:hypothetical protein